MGSGDGRGRIAGVLESSVFRHVLTAIFALAIFFSALVPVNSNDFWWHLKTGEYILQYHEVPSHDPFTYTSAADDPAYPGRQAFVLSQYWLAQASFAAVVNAFGFKGMIIFRALIFVAIGLLIVVFLRINAGGEVSFLPLILFALATSVALEDSDRPQVFSFLIALLVVLLVEGGVRGRRRWLFFLSIPVIWVASNLHGGYMAGLAFLAVYAGCSFFEERLKPFRGILVLVVPLSLAASYVNPGHWYAWRFLLPGSVPMAGTIMEYRSPFSILSHTLSNPGWVAYWVMAGLSVGAVWHHLRRGRYSWTLLLSGTLAASLLSMRFVFFFVPLATAVVALFIGETVFRSPAVKNGLNGIFVLGAAAVVFLNPHNPNRMGITSVLQDMTFPAAAADYMAAENLPQPVFNDVQYGGFLEWRLWPRYRMFTDTRELSGRVFDEYVAILEAGPKGRALLGSYGINTIITPALDPPSGRIIPLVRWLHDNPDWSVVYADGQCLIFVRTGLYAGGRRQKDSVYYEVLSELQYWRRAYPWGPGYAESRAEAMRRLGLGGN
ncbi:MAG: hypothetical protein M0Z60_08685 [Nitrospiraceae bacterium]|nr:hypothetical protein [Nitrospiraceae bacterium]